MNPIHLPPPVWVDTTEGLRALVEDLHRQSVIAVDTESNSLHAYQEQVCLIQFSTPEKDYLLDPLALPDLTLLAPLFASPEIEKIFHAAEYDLICLRRDFGFTFENLFDTMWAARLLGYEKVGLGALLERYFAVRPDKRYQRANWAKRPLPPEQLLYAQLDTHFLIPLREKLAAALEEADLWALAREDFARFTRISLAAPAEPPPCWLTVKKSHYLTPRQAAILQALCKFREKIAKRQNRPRFKVIGDRELVRIAEVAPATLKALTYEAGISRRLVDRYGKGLLRAVREGLRAAELHPPRHTHPDPAYLARLEKLQTWRKLTARQMGVESDIVLPRTCMEAIATRNPRTSEDLRALMSDIPWRYQRFGEEILRILHSSGNGSRR